ncbi:GNAT family N-acetyltransferase [Edaphobacter sp. 12200R-103]|uniref:GNAT family N-acetyltransferase n=1 Tax=Edaphobacter sp. 12200R-103 TaxID=2703788 RepID=UPI00138DC964|nr:GNAT family N-acetyltransferase [Edaphobacter sp. 12200R-103]QHS50707.1 GNAT family N-acetyltransferase [Edaphobacter sp. 12200R-103]
MAVYEFDPLTDPRWLELVGRHADSSIFHTVEWLLSLKQTYGYRPVAFSTSNARQLKDAIVFCEVSSPLTGKRLVSLPFSDHCQPLADSNQTTEILSYLLSKSRTVGWKYLELRPLHKDSFPATKRIFEANRFHFQTIDLRPELPMLLKNMHDSCIRRKIKRADKEKLEYKSGATEDLMDSFRHLFLLTRRRHRLPPPPVSWIRNLAHAFGDRLKIHMMSKDGVPAASILTITHKQTIVYKYGCSDVSFSNLGGTPSLFWKVIQQAKLDGLTAFDLGRSDYGDEGLVGFKQHLGAAVSDLIYFRNVPSSEPKSSSALSSLIGPVFSRLPDPFLEGIGNLLYRHMG